MRAPYNNDNAIPRGRSTDETGAGLLYTGLYSSSHLAEMQCVAEGCHLLKLFPMIGLCSAKTGLEVVVIMRVGPYLSIFLQ